MIPQPNFGRKEGLLKFSVGAKCFTLQCYNLMANNSRHKIYLTAPNFAVLNLSLFYNYSVVLPQNIY